MRTTSATTSEPAAARWFTWCVRRRCRHRSERGPTRRACWLRGRRRRAVGAAALASPDDDWSASAGARRGRAPRGATIPVRVRATPRRPAARAPAGVPARGSLPARERPRRRCPARGLGDDDPLVVAAAADALGEVGAAARRQRSPASRAHTPTRGAARPPSPRSGASATPGGPRGRARGARGQARVRRRAVVALRRSAAPLVEAALASALEDRTGRCARPPRRCATRRAEARASSAPRTRTAATAGRGPRGNAPRRARPPRRAPRTCAPAPRSRSHSCSTSPSSIEPPPTTCMPCTSTSWARSGGASARQSDDARTICAHVVRDRVVHVVARDRRA